MTTELIMHPRLLEHEVNVALVGAGGSGSQMLSGLARLNAGIRALGHPGINVDVFDPDVVSEANVGRQLFAPGDVGHNKAVVLVSRVNAWFGTPWRAIPYRLETARQSGEHGHHEMYISCVDSAQARVAIGRTCETRRALLWMDLGNRAQDGQMILGIPPHSDEHRAYEHRLPTVLELFPELESNAAALDADDTPSCSLAQALERQHLFVNQAVVTPALQLLWQIFRFGRISWHGAFVNLATGRTSPLAIDPAAWARFGHHATPTEPARKKRRR